jgi:Spy/CpxP family protein refolding chaperone
MSRGLLFPIAPLCIALLVSVVGCREQAGKDPSAVAESPGLAESVDARASEPATRVDIEGTVAAMWWNQGKLVRSLDLSRTQREQMDQLLADYLEPWMEMQKRRRTAPRRLMQAYKEGDIETARAVAADLGEAAAFLDGGVATLKVEVLALLSEEQLRTMVEEQQELLRRKWVVPGRVAPEGGSAISMEGRRMRRPRRGSE